MARKRLSSYTGKPKSTKSSTRGGPSSRAPEVAIAKQSDPSSIWMSVGSFLKHVLLWPFLSKRTIAKRQPQPKVNNVEVSRKIKDAIQKGIDHGVVIRYGKFFKINNSAANLQDAESDAEKVDVGDTKRHVTFDLRKHRERRTRRSIKKSKSE